MDTLNKRRAGILLPIFSLPSLHGIGTLGREAYRFADRLKEAGQSYWQILPIGPTGYGDSPYQSFSTFAGNPYFVDLDLLREEGLLLQEEIDGADAADGTADGHHVNYGSLYRTRPQILLKAYGRFRPDAAYAAFAETEAHWLDGYASYMHRKEGRSEDYYRFVQFEFFRQWFALKQYVNGLGIRMIGDIPIYVSLDSSDVETDRNLFLFAADGKPKEVAGCPPDAFAAKGQLWGNPLYDWDYHEKTGYAWWIARMKHCFKLYDIVRVDHFRGFDEYYSIPFGAADACTGKWNRGPGMKLFSALKQALGDRPIIAEDLGYVTDSVRKLVRDSGYPGMKVLEFGFDSREGGDYLPDTWTENCVAYTGTHDNQTLKGWLPELTPADLQFTAEYLHRTPEELMSGDYVYDFIRLTMNAKADTAVIPLQDYLRLSAEARINKPSTLGNNWTWRFTKPQLADKVWSEILQVTKESGRLGQNLCP